MKSIKRQAQHSLRAAFTLLELLIVLAIIVAIAAMVAPNLIGNQQTAQIRIARTTVKNIEEAVKRRAVKNNGQYVEETGTQPIADLAEPFTDALNNVHPPELEEVPVDPWNNQFQYSYSSGSGELKPRIWSTGPNGQDGDDDDISNDKREIK
ncbi:type II secretion system protein GspG [Fuerstiella marisgermanici]|uniref:Pullulanase secretion protein PulG n=1 Tax=Fuerstiella marisgermanici TaxID=1891926 RepID=A0A1P8WCB6_9PLAN|nr:type II secretion system protein GspG [Fuerstiella marisgermanici]APZ91700.1 Pullulanase secretion protein PulG [Fuerstiella marisgermanici]